MRITYCSPPSHHLWMKYKSQVVHIYASLQTTAAYPNRNSFSHLPSEDTTIFQSLFLPPVSDAIDQMIEDLKENTVPVLLLLENAFVGVAEIFTETFLFV